MSDESRRSAIDALISERLSRATSIPHTESTTAPLTHVQQSLWLTAQLAADEPTNNRPLWLSLRGDLDATALHEAINAVVRRHPVLRSTFPLEGGEPVQVSGHPLPPTPIHDVSNEPDPVRAARSLAAAHTTRAFDLGNEAPFVPLLIRISPSDHLLAFAMHHIVFDGWSEPLLVNELVAHYDAAVEGTSATGLPDLTIDYADHARWERTTTSDESFETELQYWRRQLGDLPPDLDLPEDRAVAPGAVASPVTIEIARNVMSGLEDLAKRHNATLFMVLLAALEVLIARHAGVDDVVVGVPTPGRPRSETENLIGCFINLVPIRTHLQGNPNFSSVVEQTRRTTLEALENSSVPYGQIFGAVRPWSADRVPLYRVHFQMRDFHHERRVSNYLEVGVLEPQLGPSNHLTVRATTTPSGATITFSYHPERFEQTTIERWLGHYARLLEAVGGNADPTILDIPLMGDDERRTLLEVFNPDESPYLPVPELAADGLRATAQRWPEVVAMEDGARRVTYAEFDRMVDAIAWSLADQGLAAEDTVILHADRSIEAAAAVFGAMRAGVAYVPIDAELTSEWLETVIEQTKPGLILTTRVTSPRPDGLKVVEISNLVAEEKPPFPGKPNPQDLAYLLYTSGSTGPPKGVMIDQGNVAWFLEQCANFEPLGVGDRIVWFHSLSFDAHMNSLHAALVGGATVVVRDDASIYSIPRLVGWLADHQITHLRISAGFFHVLVEELVATNSTVPDTLKLIAFGGEQVRADIINTWLEMTGGSIRTIDSYGPTEVTVWVAANDFPEPQPATHEWISIGPPRAPSQVYVLDSLGELAPIGIHGELFLGGPLVARGYLNAPELTAQRFTPDRFSKLEGTRMYRSGDVGRWLPNGTLEVIGRVDRQVKIRGYRVEPAEVEAALRAVAGIDAAVVVASPATNGELELRAFVTTDDGSPIDLQAMRDSLGIPKFMVPAKLTQVPEIPLTIGGKVDGNALLRDEIKTVDPPAAALDHVDAIERIWCDVLGVEAVERQDDFFALGGHSLLAIKVISRIKAQLDLAIELTQLFEYPTFGAFSDMITATARGTSPEETDQTFGSVPGDDNDLNGDTGLDDFLTALEQMTDEEAEAMMRQLDAGQD